MKRVMAAVLTCAVLLGMLGASAEEGMIGLVYMTSFANVRREPDAEAEAVGMAEGERYYNCFGEEDGWYLVKTESGEMGYVSGKRCEFYAVAAQAEAWPLAEDGIRHYLPGDIVLFGAYEQDNLAQNGPEPIEWIVLERNEEEGRLTLLTRCAIERRHYHTTNSHATWKTCGLRKWLNEEFFQTAFSEEEQRLIETTLVTADKNKAMNVLAGEDTEDRVFLLSVDEAEKYLTPETLLCRPTASAIVKNSSYDPKTGGCWWWLRTPGHNRMHTAYVDGTGEISPAGYGVISNRGAVRPAIVIDLNAMEKENALN